MAGVVFKLVLACALLFTSGARAQGPDVDTALVLAIDSSSSVDANEFLLQMQGLAEAFRDPTVQAGALAGPKRKIAVALMEWSNPGWQRVNIPWRVLTSPDDLEQLAKDIENAPRLVDGGGTALGNAMEAAARLFRGNAPTATRRVIDVSGDGRSNMGRSVTGARDAITMLNVTINGLAIQNEEADLGSYFEESVIGGSGAFMIDAKDYEDFRRAIRAKLLRELEIPVAYLSVK
ncbi:DUF1194 domain-containing protein [Lacibacterium aquatile]|uniref:DUF1194 domain-containing protein n=1 Tax=Lacibacterium aquatile TaxID=1168082 RepID=A0ABW5DJR2_9PROT